MHIGTSCVLHGVRAGFVFLWLSYELPFMGYTRRMSEQWP